MQRVAIIGTGATSVQAVPHLARAAKQLFVVQRTPSSVDAPHTMLKPVAGFNGSERPRTSVKLRQRRSEQEGN